MTDATNHADSTRAVREAISNTPSDYLQRTLEIHGRSFPLIERSMTPADDLKAWAMSAEWAPYEHPAIQAPAVGYRASRKGRMLVTPVVDLMNGEVITFDERDAKSERTGFVMGNVVGVEGPEVDFVVALLGPDEGKTVLWTIHAGDPITPSRMPTAEWAGRRISAVEAHALDIEYVRC